MRTPISYAIEYGRVLPRSFYTRGTLTVAPDLIGKALVHITDKGTAVGTVVEVEAYIGERDPACHAASGFTFRNAPLYGPPGHAYIYLNYGIHHLFNVVTEPEGAPAALLLRAVEPLEGLDLMHRRRARSPLACRGSLSTTDLCRGPGNLSRAFGISLSQNCLDLTGGRLFIVDAGRRTAKIEWTPRIGIQVGTDRRWRCCAVDNRCVSGSPRLVL